MRKLIYLCCAAAAIAAVNPVQGQSYKEVTVAGYPTHKSSSLKEVVVEGKKIEEPPRISKTITHEANAKNGSFIRIVSSAGKLSIKNWEQPKVKVTVEIEFDSTLVARKDEAWFEDLGISVKPFSDRVDILTRKGSGSGFYTVYGTPSKVLTTRKVPSGSNLFGTARKVTGVATTTTYRAASIAKTTIKSMTIQIPPGCKLDVDNEYGDVVIGMNLDEAKLDISNGTLDAGDIKDLTFTGKYCNANLGNLGKAEIEFSNGTLRARNINDLDLESKSSTIEYENGNYLYMRSETDHITIEKIAKIDGRKLYGSIKLDELLESFDLEGNNVDIKIRDINPSVNLIKINNKYGDVRLPVKSLKNYFVDFNGYYSTVFAPFKKEVVPDKEEDTADNDKADAKTPAKIESVYVRSTRASALLGELAPHHFTSTVGDVNSKHTRFELTCNSCTVDFK